MTVLKRLIIYYWRYRYLFLRHRWNKSRKDSILDGIVMMFHHVTDCYVDVNESCKCEVSRFEEIINGFIKQNRCFVSVDTMIEIIKAKRPTPFTVVSFDDVPDNFYYNAYPILKKYKIPFVLFITTGFIGTVGYMTENQIKELDSDDLCTIGAHTVTHPMLRQSEHSYKELVDSKKSLENLLGHDVNYMAYPYGRQSSVSRSIMREAKDAGYLCAFGTIQSPITDKSSNNLYYLPRVVIK